MSCAVIVVVVITAVNHYFPKVRHVLNPHGLVLAFQKSHGNLAASDSNLIRSWMTFDYINTIFKLPPDYLKGQLSISDPHYPRVSISSYAKNNSLNESAFLGEIQQTVRGYVLQVGPLVPNPVTNTP